jgi:large repetitive protein
MTRLTCPALAVFVAAAALAAPAPAAAQSGERDPRKAPSGQQGAGRSPSRPNHTVGISFRVDSFAPTRGQAGVRVEIKGNGFTRSTEVLVGGRPAKVLSWRPSEIAFALPGDLAGDADIVLRKPGAAELPVGTYDLVTQPVIRSLYPAAGGPGTRVEVRGSGFEKADTLTMNARPLAVTEWAPDRLVTVIPEGAATDHIFVVRPSGERARSPDRFRVLPQSPIVARFTPESGPPGTRVRISGSGFTPTDRVLYGRTPAAVLGRGAGWVDVDVPRRAARSEHFVVRGRYGLGRSDRPFGLDLAPEITSFAPNRGAPGTEVDIYGRNFRDGDWVSLAGKRLPIIRLEPRRIRVTIPIGSESGRLAVGRDRYENAISRRFEVFNPPTLTAFTPTRGEPGTRVTLTGSHLADVEVYYGRARIPVRSRRGDTSIVVDIPRAARDERFRVRSRAGTAESPQVFQVQYYTVIEDARPRSGVPGTTVVLSGRHLDKADEFYVGSIRFELVARDNNSATVKVPDRARSAPVTWTSFGRRGETAWRFDVLSAPVISQFQPTYGAAGTEIIIRGDHIDRRTEVYFGRDKLRVVRVSPPHEIAVRLPANAAGTDYLYLAGYGARIRSEQRFEVRTAPVITSVNPPAARPGKSVQVRGRWFTDATEILIGKQRSRVIRREPRTGSILIEVPRGLAPGLHPISARSEALVTEYRHPFEVLAVATITGATPDRARWGHRIRIDGNGMGQRARIWFGAVELPIIKRSPDGTQVWVVIPDSARGTAYLEVDDGSGERERGQAQLTIEAPGKPKPPPRDHRERKPAKKP